MPLAVYLLGLTIFSITTSEFMVAGMMPSLTQALGVPVAQIGYLITLYAAGMVVGGPLLTALLLWLRAPNKQALLGLLMLYTVAQSVAAAAPDHEVMAVARVATGVAGSACFGMALAICAEMVDAQSRGRAASIVLGGLMLASVLGVPMATWVDQHFGWRASFWSVAAVAVLCTTAIAAWVPRSERPQRTGLGAELSEFRNPHLWAAYTSSALIIGATFSAFSYFAPILTQVSGFSSAAIPWLLCLYGAANVIGNAIAGRFADRHTYAVMVCGLIALVLALVAFALFAHRPAIGLAMMLIIGLVGVSMNPAMIARVMKTSHPGPLVNAMHTSVINIGLGVGAWLGGVGIGNGYGLRSPLWVGALLAVFGLLSLTPYLRRAARAPLPS